MPTPAAPPPPAIHRADRAALRVVAALALAGAAVGVVSTVAALLPWFTEQSIAVDLLLTSGASADELAPGVRSIEAESALVEIDSTALSGGAVALLLVERSLIALIGALVAAAIGYTLLRITGGQAFHRSLFAVTVAVGALLSIGMMIAVGLGGFGRMMAGVELNEIIGDERFVPGFSADPTIVLVGFAVLGLAYVFRIGGRLRRETDGLV